MLLLQLLLLLLLLLSLLLLLLLMHKVDDHDYCNSLKALGKMNGVALSNKGATFRLRGLLFLAAKNDAIRLFLLAREAE